MSKVSKTVPFGFGVNFKNVSPCCNICIETEGVLSVFFSPRHRLPLFPTVRNEGQHQIFVFSTSIMSNITLKKMSSVQVLIGRYRTEGENISQPKPEGIWNSRQRVQSR